LALTSTELAIGLATAWAGPTAAPIATVLMTSAAAMATSVRVNDDCDDIDNLLFRPLLSCGPMPIPNQGACHSQKSAKNVTQCCAVAHFPSQILVSFPNPGPGTFERTGASSTQDLEKEFA
jgi:hypothetical protein